MVEKKVEKNKKPTNSQEKWDKRFLNLAREVSTWSTCVRNQRQVGSVIVRDKRIIATGFNGAPSGVTSCQERGYCLRDKLGIASGTRQEVCYSTHATAYWVQIA